MEKKKSVTTEKAVEKKKAVSKPAAKAETPVAKKATITPKAPKPAPASAEKAVSSAPAKVKTAAEKKDKKATVSNGSFYGTGKRKSAIARVWISKGTGLVNFNRKPGIDYIKSELLIAKVKAPLKKLGLESQYDCNIFTVGGGLVAQADASRLGVSRALLLVSADYRKPLKEEGFLTRDPRVKERKKYGKKRARKGFQFRKR